MALRYLELRRFHSPVAVASRELERLAPQTIALLRLQPRTAKGQAGGPVEWTPRFAEAAQALAFASRDPGDELSGKAAKGRLTVAFNAEAVAAFARVIRETGGANAPPWELESLQLSLIGNSPLMHVLSVFRPIGRPAPDRFEEESNALNLLNDQFWPVFLAVVEEIRRRTPAEVWTGERMPFGLPPTFLARGHSDFDPSEEYHFEAHLFVQGSDQELARWREHAVPGRQEMLQKPSRTGATVRISWGTTVWELPASAPEPSVEAMVEEVLGTSLASDMLKVITFRDRLYAALLEDAQSGRIAVPADELRDVIYRDHSLWQAMSQRGRSLSEFHRHYYQVAKEVYQTDEHVESVRHLGNLVIHVAEGIEADDALGAERRLQRIALFLSIVMLGSLAIDALNFVLSSPSEASPLASAELRGWVAGGLLLTLSVLALLFSRLVIGNRKSRSKERRGGTGE
jgi:hypothetical protein